MPNPHSEEREYGNPSLQRKVFVISAMIYPLWHVAAPSSATDPWWVWWAIAAIFLTVAGASLRFPAAARHQLLLLHLCAWLCTLQLYVLSHINEMNPFYVVGSVMAVLATAASLRSKPVLLGFAAFVAILSAVLFALEPEGRRAAYWGGTLTVIGAAYYRLAGQLSAAQLVHEHQERLEERVRERTAELSEASRRLRSEMEKRTRLEGQLRFSQKMEAMGLLAGGVAHEFNNLLTTISIYADLLLEHPTKDPDVREEAAQIGKAGRQAAALTQQLLTFSRKGVSRTEVLDLDDVVREVSSMLRRLVGEDSELVCRLDGPPHPIRANREELGQVLVNLALNARDAMPDGGTVSIETSTARRADLPVDEAASSFPDDEYVVLSMTDTGVGMDSEVRARVFDPFFTTRQVEKGTGLGLSIVYGIVNQTGGTVRVQSEPGRGARFELYWPRARELPAPHQALRPERPVSGGGERILLVENERELRRAVQRVLCGQGYAVIDAEDGEVALKLAAADADGFDLVITDVVMPRMSGFQLVGELSTARPDLKVLLVSGQLNHPSLRGQELPHGVTILPKPFSLRDLTSKVRKVLDAPPVS